MQVKKLHCRLEIPPFFPLRSHQHSQLKNVSSVGSTLDDYRHSILSIPRSRRQSTLSFSHPYSMAQHRSSIVARHGRGSTNG